MEIQPAGEQEAEKASNSYLMSLVFIMAGLPLPIVNLIASLIFYFGNRKAGYFVRWHCTQSLLSQFTLLFINSTGFWWTISVFFGGEEVTSAYISYLLTALVFNLLDFFSTIYTAIQTRKGIHVKWFFFGDLTDRLCPPTHLPS